MNKAVLIGRLTRKPIITYSQSETAMCIARYTLAVNRRFKKDEGQDADFISCIAFGKSAEFAEKYLHKGTKIAVVGRIQTGSYVNNEGVRIYTTDVVVEDHEFVESKSASGRYVESSGPAPSIENPPSPSKDNEGFMDIPDGLGDDLPFI